MPDNRMQKNQTQTLSFGKTRFEHAPLHDRRGQWRERAKSQHPGDDQRPILSAPRDGLAKRCYENCVEDRDKCGDEHPSQPNRPCDWPQALAWCRFRRGRRWGIRSAGHRGGRYAWGQQLKSCGHKGPRVPIAASVISNTVAPFGVGGVRTCPVLYGSRGPRKIRKEKSSSARSRIAAVVARGWSRCLPLAPSEESTFSERRLRDIQGKIL